MRVGYFGYTLRDRRTGERYLVDLRRFFRDFAASNDIGFKSQFRYGGESLLLQMMDEGTNTYLFVQSRDHELVKRIQRQRLAADDISNVLGANGSVGFASYVVIGRNWISFACRVLSPRQTAFANFANELFQVLGLDYDFVLTTLQTELAQDRVQQLSRVGKIKIEVNAASPLMKRIGDLLTGGDGEELVDAAEIHISVVPVRKRDADLSQALQSMIESVPRNGLQSIEARAKLDEADRMSDMFIYGSGAIRDFVDVENENEIPGELRLKRRRNEQLRAKLEEFRGKEEYRSDRTAGDLGIAWARAYANRLNRG